MGFLLPDNWPQAFYLSPFLLNKDWTKADYYLLTETLLCVCVHPCALYLSVDVSTSLQQPQQALWVAPKCSDVSGRLSKPRGHRVDPTAHLHQTRHTLQLCVREREK